MINQLNYKAHRLIYKMVTGDDPPAEVRQSLAQPSSSNKLSEWAKPNKDEKQHNWI